MSVTETPVTISFPWEQNASPATKVSMVETRRERLLEIMEHFADEGNDVQLERLAIEWNALTEVRDMHIREQFNREKELQHAEKVLALKTMLEEVCDQNVFQQNGEVPLKYGVFALLEKIRAYCANKTVTAAETAKLKADKEKWENAYESFKQRNAAPPPPPLPPPPPPAPPPPTMTAKHTGTPRPASRSTASKSKVQFRSPLKSMSVNSDIMSAITESSRNRLKATPHKLSPGGTPAKGSKYDSYDNPITLALKHKFKNIAIGSPIAESPNAFESPRIESSGSTPYSVPVFAEKPTGLPPKLVL